MKKLTFLIPTYNANIFLKQNIEMWKKLSQYVELLFVEDSKDEKSKKIINENKLGRYYSKENGNWGSVINFAKKNKMIQTQYMAIVDPDDILNIQELKQLITYLENNDKDIIISNYKIFYNDSKKEKLIHNYWFKYVFIHQIWFSTKLFYQTEDLKENISYSDIYLVFQLLNLSKNIKRLKVHPYIYQKNINGQTCDYNFDNFKKNWDNAKKNRDPFIPLKKEIKRPFKRNKKVVYDIGNNFDLKVIRHTYDNVKDRKQRKELSNLYKKETKNRKVPLGVKMIWSKIYVFFSK